MKTSEKTLLIATNNQGKLLELREMFGRFSLDLASLLDHPNIPEVPESGSTFEENARLKAAGYASATSLTAVADDSGLEIDALGGRPGVLSARYGGDKTSFDEKMTSLLHELAETGDFDRRARFVCSIAISDPGGNILFETRGVCEGTIAASQRGKGGFGYDPIFVPDGHNLTFAELPASVKREISHRSHAFRSIIPFLRDFIAN